MGNLFIQCKENKSKLPAEQHRNFQGVVSTNILHSAWAMEHSLHVSALTSPYIGTQPMSVNLKKKIAYTRCKRRGRASREYVIDIAILIGLTMCAFG